MAARSTQKLKELIYTTLKNNGTLVALLGSVNKIKHSMPLARSEYPCVVYELLIDTDEPFQPDVPTQVSKTRLVIQCFSSDRASKQVDDIDDQVYASLHGAKLTNNDYMVYSSTRVMRLPLFEGDPPVWRIESRYDLTNGPK